MVLDHRYQRLDQVREYLSYAIYPLQWVVNMPVRLAFECRGYFVSHHQLIKETESLRQEQFLQNARLQKLTALEAENLRLLTLLNASPRVGETLRVAEIIQVDADPFSHNILLNKGRRDQVTLGQPIIDDHGVMGEIVEVHATTSRAILLTDASHAIPVENVRNGVRGIIVGTGALNGLELQYVPTTADIKEGDVLVTSGLGGRYPPGYPVGTVSQINQDKRESFASIRVLPTAQLERGRQLLLVERNNSDPTSIASDTPTHSMMNAATTALTDTAKNKNATSDAPKTLETATKKLPKKPVMNSAASSSTAAKPILPTPASANAVSVP